MRKFTRKEIDYIVEKEDKYTLQELAKQFNCVWQEIYNVYSNEVEKDSYRRKTGERNKKIIDRLRAARQKKLEEVKNV